MVVWSVQSPIATAVLYGVYAFGWALVFLSSFLINHFDLFGLRQVWLQLRGQPYKPVSFGRLGCIASCVTRCTSACCSRSGRRRP